MNVANGYSLEALRDGAALERCAEEWRRLPQALADPLLAPEWTLAALPALHARPCVLALRAAPATGEPGAPGEPGALVALAPLARESRAGFARLELIGTDRLNEPAGFLHADPEALSRLCDCVATQGMPVVLRRVSASDPLIGAFRRAVTGRGRLLERHASAAPCVDFPRDGSSYEASLSARRRQDYRRARRKLEERGPVTFDLRIPSTATVGGELAEVMRVEACGWKARRGSALARAPELGAYFGQLAQRLAARRSLRICFLRVGGTAIAAQLAIEHGKRWWILKIGYDEEWAEYSPGIQLMWDVVRHAGESGLESVEMLGSAEQWLSIWAREVREFRTLVFYPYNGRGLGAFAADVAGAMWRRLRK